MKAKVIKTGEIVNIVRDIDGGFIEVAFNLNSDQRRWGPTELDLDYEYWQSFRREAAKEILAGILSHQRILYDESLRPEQVRMAISYTDELIKQLRENEK